MPIYGIQDRGLRFPRLGSIRKGEQVPVVKDGKPVKRNGEVVMRPIERPWFVFSVDPLRGKYVSSNDKEALVEQEKTEYKYQHELLERIYSLYGSDKITMLNAFLPYPNAHDAFSFWLEAYVANQKVAQSDERIVTYLYDTMTTEVLIRRGMVIRHSSNPNSVAGSLVKEIAIGGVLPYEENMVIGETRTKSDPITFKPVGRLNIVIPELKQAATWMVFTGAWSDISSIYSAVELINQASMHTQQPANTIPLTLTRVPVTTRYEDENGKTRTSEKHYIEAKVVSSAVTNLLTMYEDTPFMMQLESGIDKQEDFSQSDEPASLDEVTEDVGNSDFFKPFDASEYEPFDVEVSDVDSEDRPYSPEALKEAVTAIANHHKRNQTQATTDKPKILAKHLNDIFGGSDTDRYVFTAWIFGKGSAKAILANEILGLLDWLEVDKFGDIPNEYCKREALDALAYINETRGQKELPVK